MEKNIRYRINVSRTSKGLYSYDCTVDAENYEMVDALRKSDELVAELNKRYPVAECPIENK
jgi:hypothetical protein